MTTSSPGAGSVQPARPGSTESERTARLCAETALFMRDHVLSLVSHDLRGPLNAIHSWGYVLERKLDPNDPNALRAMAGIRSGVEQQVKLLETIVDTTRAGTKTLALTRESFALQAMLDETAGEVRAGLARQRGVSLELDSALATEQLSGDRDRLASALWLMFTFAVEASARDSTVKLASKVEANAWHTVVTFDPTPAALEDANLAHWLEPFALKQAREPRDAGRISWVLALCMRVAQAHGGAFEQGEMSEGTPATLTLRVPLAGA